jgi:hypothetical protein
LCSSGAQLLSAEVSFCHGGVDGDHLAFFPIPPSILDTSAENQLGQRPVVLEDPSKLDDTRHVGLAVGYSVV